MTDDLVKRLRYDAKTWSDKICDEAADRIEQLEAALRQIERVPYQHFLSGPENYEALQMAARAALGEKKDD